MAAAQRLLLQQLSGEGTDGLAVESLYPNPVADRATLVLNRRFLAPETQLTVTDALGRTHRPDWSSVGNGRLELDAGGLAAGWYVATVVQGEEAAQISFVVR